MALVREIAGPVCTGRQLCKVLPPLPVQASYVTDFFVLYMLRKRRVYHSHKYQKVKEDRDDGFILVDDDASVTPMSYKTVGVTR